MSHLLKYATLIRHIPTSSPTKKKEKKPKTQQAQPKARTTPPKKKPNQQQKTPTQAAKLNAGQNQNMIVYSVNTLRVVNDWVVISEERGIASKVRQRAWSPFECVCTTSSF